MQRLVRFGGKKLFTENWTGDSCSIEGIEGAAAKANGAQDPVGFDRLPLHVRTARYHQIVFGASSVNCG